MAIGLGIIGVLFGVTGALIISKVTTGAPLVGLFGFIIGHPTGIIVGVIIVKIVLHQRGSLLLGILGGIFGEAFVAFIASPLDLYNSIYFGYPMFFLSAPVFCLAGFYLGGRIPSIWKRDK
jgi:hypothetical protein